MGLYVDCFLLPIPTKNLAIYKKMAAMGKKVWMEHGALFYVEAVLDDSSAPWCLAFDKQMGLKKGETAVVAFVTYKNKTDRNRVTKKVMSDPRMNKMPKVMPFDMKRMAFGGFKTLVDAQAPQTARKPARRS